MEKKSELEKRLENVQNVLGTSQTAKKPKLGSMTVDGYCCCVVVTVQPRD